MHRLSITINVCQNGSWMAIWDAALEHGSKGTRYTQALLRALSQPVFCDRRCPLSNSIGCNCCIAENVTAMEHFCNCHSISADVDTIINPRRACARVTVLVLSVCVCVCFPYSGTSRNQAYKQQYQRLQRDTGMKYKKGFFFKTLRSEVMASFTHLE